MADNPTKGFRQLAMRPAGVPGRILGMIMERANGPSYRAAIDALAPVPGERFLEIGFGTGRLVQMLLDHHDDITVAGVDPTATMVETARNRRRVRLAGSRADLRLGKDCPLPWDVGTFHGVVAVNSFQFWPDPLHTLTEIYRVLMPLGRVVLVLRDHSEHAPDWLPNAASRSGNECEEAQGFLHRADFVDVEELEPVGASRVLRARAEI